MLKRKVLDAGLSQTSHLPIDSKIDTLLLDVAAGITRLRIMNTTNY
jgi:hypothetical protein